MGFKRGQASHTHKNQGVHSFRNDPDTQHQTCVRCGCKKVVTHTNADGKNTHTYYDRNGNKLNEIPYECKGLWEKELAGLTMYAVEDEPNHIDWLINVEVIDSEKKELKKIEQKPVEWHREDEQNLNACLGFIPDAYLCRWLKDVIHVKYDKPAWSEEDKNMLKWVTRYLDNKMLNTPIVEERTACKNAIAWLEKLTQSRQEWSEEDKEKINSICNIIADKMFVQKQAYKSYYKSLINFLKSLKDRVIQPKQEWSEEDEVKINRIVACLENLNVADNDILLKDITWFKSIKDRYTWKPSDEQMVQLSKYCPDNMALTSLYEQLKKLREE